jgi:hypothetical protein
MSLLMSFGYVIPDSRTHPNQQTDYNSQKAHNRRHAPSVFDTPKRAGLQSGSIVAVQDAATAYRYKYLRFLVAFNPGASSCLHFSLTSDGN